MIRAIKSLRIELVALSMHSKSICFIFSINEKRYVKRSSICEKNRRNAEIITRKRI